jgi:hypothetical protein
MLRRYLSSQHTHHRRPLLLPRLRGSAQQQQHLPPGWCPCQPLKQAALCRMSCDGAALLLLLATTPLDLLLPHLLLAP